MDRKNTTIQSIIFMALPIFLVILSPIMFVNSYLNNDTDMIIFWMFATLISWGILFLGLKLLHYCCPKCGGFFCMRKAKESILNKKAITMQETRKVEKYSSYKKQYGN